MRKSKKISSISSIQKLDYIKQNLCTASKERITAAVLSITNEEKLESLLSIFSTSVNLFSAERDELMEKSEEYKNYATDCNGVVSTEYKTLASLKNQIFFLYQLLNTISKRPAKRPGYSPMDSSSMEYRITHSILGTQPYTVPLFEVSNFRQHRLIMEITIFLQLLESNLSLCKQIIEDEDATKSDAQECKRLLMKQIDEIYSYGLDNCKLDKVCPDYVYELLEAKKDPQFAQKWYHQITPKKLTKVAAWMKKDALSKYSKYERKAFDNNLFLLERYYQVMDSIVKERSKPTGDLMYFVMKYSKCDSSPSQFYHCFVDTYKKLNGANKCVTIQRFYQVYEKSNIWGNDNYNTFCLKMDDILAKAS